MKRIALLAAVGLLFGAQGALAQTGYSVQSDGDDQLYSINLNTGVITAIGPSGFVDVESLTFDLAGNVLYAVDDDTNQLLTCNIVTGACTAVGSLGVAVIDQGLTFACDGGLYMSVDDPTNLYRLNPATGAATLIGNQGQEVTGLGSRSPDGTCASGVFGLGGDSTDNLGCMDINTGAFDTIGALVNVTLGDGGIDFAPDGTLWGVEDDGDLFTIDPATGTATVQFSIADDFEGLAVAGSTECANALIPALSPNMLVLLAALLGLAGLLTLSGRFARSRA